MNKVPGVDYKCATKDCHNETENKYCDECVAEREELRREAARDAWIDEGIDRMKERMRQ